MPEFQLNTPPAKAHPFYSLGTLARGYVEAMFFTNCDSGNEERENHANELGVERLTRASVAAIKRDCDAFESHIMPDGCTVRQWIDRAANESGYEDEQAGRDFWLTRQGHGCGFWDRDELRIDLFEPINPAPGLGGWIVRDDEAEQGPCKGTIGDGLADAAKHFGESYPEIYRGWIHYR